MVRRDAQRLEHVEGARRPRGRGTRRRGRDRRAGHRRRAGPRRPGPAAAGGAGAAADVAHFGVARFSWQDVPCLVAGTGYTGEDGVEVAVPADAAPAFWEAVMDAGIPPAGLGARDTLRLEAGLPLHGHELGPRDHAAPGRTRLGGGVGQARVPGPGRPGRRARAGGRPSRAAVWCATAASRPGKGAPSSTSAGTVVGTVTSGNFSPVLGLRHRLGVPPARHRGRRPRHHRRAGPIPGRPRGRPAVRVPEGQVRCLFVRPGPRWLTSRPIPTPRSRRCSPSAAWGPWTSCSTPCPAAIRLAAGSLALPDGLSEPDTLAELERLAGANRVGRDLVCFAGGGAYDHDVASVVRRVGFRAEYVTAYTPYQPEVAQGVLQALFEYQTLVARLSRPADRQRQPLRRGHGDG